MLIHEYEREHHAVDVTHLGGLDSLKYLMAEHDMNGSDLGRLLGNVSLGSKILRGERRITARHARILGRHFKLDPGVFIAQRSLAPEMNHPMPASPRSH